MITDKSKLYLQEMAELLAMDWLAAITKVETEVDVDVVKSHCKALEKFFKTDVGFAKPALCTVPQDKMLAHTKCPTDLRLVAGFSRVMTALTLARRAKRNQDELDAAEAVRLQQQQGAGTAPGGGAVLPSPQFPPTHPQAVSELERDSAMFLMGNDGSALDVCK